jgi:hypothetical protein
MLITSGVIGAIVAPDIEQILRRSEETIAAGSIHEAKTPRFRTNTTGRPMTTNTPPRTIFLVFTAVLEPAAV